MLWAFAAKYFGSSYCTSNVTNAKVPMMTFLTAPGFWKFQYMPTVFSFFIVNLDSSEHSKACALCTIFFCLRLWLVE